MVYSRSVLTAILAAGAVSSVLAVPVPDVTLTPSTSVNPSSATGNASQRLFRRAGENDPQGHPEGHKEHHGQHRIHHKGVSQQSSTQQGSSTTAAATDGSTTTANPAADGSTSTSTGAAPGATRRSIHEENRHHNHAFHQLKEAVERVDHAKERLSAAEDHLHHLFHIEDEGEFVSKHRLYKAKHRLHQAEHRLHIAEKHLHQVKHEFEEGEFDRKHHHGHDHFRLGKAAAPPFIQEGLQDAAELLAALRLDQHAAAPGSKHEEAPVAFEIAIAPRGNGVPSTATSNQQAGGIANAPGQNMKRSVGPLGNNATAGMATPTRRSLHGDDLD